jgi:5-methylcytosine-specific restriction endonuclease McrA
MHLTATALRTYKAMTINAEKAPCSKTPSKALCHYMYVKHPRLKHVGLLRMRAFRTSARFDQDKQWRLATKEIATLNISKQTHSGVLPQPRTLEDQIADNPRESGRNGFGRRGSDPKPTGVQHVRGERGGDVNPSPSPAKEKSGAASGVSRVFVLTRNGKPLMPCKASRARILLNKGRARVHKLYPFTIRLVDRTEGEIQPVAVKLDPGADTTGLAVVRENQKDPSKQIVLHLAEVSHRRQTVRKHMTQRAMFRRRRRTANLRYRAPRFDNRIRFEGWLPPSLQTRVDNLTSLVGRYRAVAPISSISVETVRFDMQRMENPEISGIEYQQGTLAGYECREYLLEKWGRKCAYCDAENVPLQIEHIQPKGRRGSDRISNLTLACGPCNEAKGCQPVELFLASKPEKLKRILAQSKKPLDGAAAANSTRTALAKKLRETGLPLYAGSGGRTKFNRQTLGLPKAHALDAACVGAVSRLEAWNMQTLRIKATGRGSYQRTQLDSQGFPRGYLTRSRTVHGFRTGDLVRAIVPSGKKAGTHTGRVAVRASGSFNIQTGSGTVQGINWKRCRRVMPDDGYTYIQQPMPIPPGS